MLVSTMPSLEFKTFERDYRALLVVYDVIEDVAAHKHRVRMFVKIRK